MEMRALIVMWNGWTRSSDVSIMRITYVLNVIDNWKEAKHALMVSTFAKAIIYNASNYPILMFLDLLAAGRSVNSPSVLHPPGS